MPVPHNETADMHVLYCLLNSIHNSYVWDKIISRASSTNLFFLAYSQGGIQAKNLIQFFATPDNFRKQGNESVYLINKYPERFEPIPEEEESSTFVFVKL